MDIKVVNHRGVEFKSNSQPDFWNGLAGWEPQTFDVFDRFIGPGRVLIDIGAWNGVLSIYAAKKGARVVAYEPDPVAFMYLRDNLQINGINIPIHRSAVTGRREDTRQLYVNGELGDSMSSMIAGVYPAKEPSIVHAVHILDAIEGGPDLLKIDTEGAELEMLVGPQIDVIKSRCPAIYVALHPNMYGEQKKMELLAFLEQHFAIEYFIHDNVLLTPLTIN